MKWRYLFPIFLGLAGCSSQPPVPTTIQGKIYYHKQPVLGGGTIVFTPDSRRGSSGPITAGEIHADGAYTITPQPGKPPILSGWFKVTLLSSNSSIPGKYSDPNTSGLVREIRSGATNQTDFFLE